MLQVADELKRVAGRVADSSVVEDGPLLCAGGVEKSPREAAKERCVVCGIVGAGCAVESPVAEAIPPTGCGGEWRAFGRIGSDTRDLEAAQEAVDRWSKPTGMARLQGDEAGMRMLWMEFANCGEEIMCECFVECELGRKLHEKGPEFFAKATDLLEEDGQQFAGVCKECSVGDGLRKLHGEAEVRRGAARPALPGFALMWTVEAGVDLNTIEALGGAFEVCAGFRKVLSMLLRQRPTGSADADGAQRYRRFGLSLIHLWLDAS